MLSGYYFYTSDGTKTSGEIPTRSASSTTVTSGITYSSGYYPNNWTVTGLDTSDADATAKNIEKNYIAYVKGVRITGIANVQHGVFKYSGSITLSAAKHYLAATSIGNYALFGGGNADSTYYDTVDAYDTNLVRSSPTGLYSARNQLAATSIGSYALFMGGYNNKPFTTVEKYSTSLSRSSASALSVARYGSVATSNSTYAICAGGWSFSSNNISTISNVVDAYNTSLSRSTPTALSTARPYLAATTIGNYALFGGGGTNTSVVSTVDRYNASLTKSTATALSEGRYGLAAASIKNYYAIFGGGRGSSDYRTGMVDVYNTSLSKSTATSLSYGGKDMVATSVGEYYVIFGGGDSSREVEAYDINLTKSILEQPDQSTQTSATTSIGDYGLIGGGGGATTSSKSNIINAYYDA